jgi:hypothetical protein
LQPSFTSRTIEDQSHTTIAEPLPSLQSQQISVPSYGGIPATFSENADRHAASPNSLDTPISGPSEKSAYIPHHHPGQLYSQDPRVWTVADVSEWLYSKNIAPYIIQVCKNEGINGRSLLSLSKDDMGQIGIRLYGERLELATLISELKATWRLSDGIESMLVNAPASGSQPLFLDNGKGPMSTEFPPSYSPK